MRSFNSRLVGLAFFVVALGLGSREAAADDYSWGPFTEVYNNGTATFSGTFTWGSGDSPPDAADRGTLTIYKSDGTTYGNARITQWTVDTTNMKVTWKFETSGIPSGSYTYKVTVPIPGGTDQVSDSQDLTIP